MHAVSGQTLEVEMNELTQGLKDIRGDIREISSSQERMEDDHFEAVMSVSAMCVCVVWPLLKSSHFRSPGLPRSKMYIATLYYSLIKHSDIVTGQSYKILKR